MDVTTADMWTVLRPDSPHLALLREVAEFRGPGYNPRTQNLPDYEPLVHLAELGLVTLTYEPLGTYAPDGWTEDYGTIAHVTEDGLEEVVLHGRAR